MTDKKEVVVFKQSALDKIYQGLTDDSIKELAERCKALQVKDVNDKTGYNHVYESHQIIKKYISGANEAHKEGKAKIVEAGRMFDAEKKRFINLMVPIRDDLQAKRDIIDKEKERLEKLEKERIENIKAERSVELIKYGAVFDGLNYDCCGDIVKPKDLGILDDDVYQGILRKVKSVFEEKERERLETERIEREKREAEEKRQAEIAEQNRIQEEAQRKREQEIAERERKVKEAEEEHRQAEQKRLQKEAAEQAKREERERIQREAEEKAEAERKAKAEKERAERLRPDKDKLIEFSAFLWHMDYPKVQSKEAKEIILATKAGIDKVSETIRTQAEKL